MYYILKDEFYILNEVRFKVKFLCNRDIKGILPR